MAYRSVDVALIKDLHKMRESTLLWLSLSLLLMRV